MSASNVPRADFLPSPWMLVHAFFDNAYQKDKGFLSMIESGFIKLLSDVYGDINTDGAKAGVEIANAITSKSGRSGYLQRTTPDIANVLSELLTQAIVKETGCNLDLESTPDFEGKMRLRRVQDWINSLNIRQLMVSSLGGR